jgi:hypothetical protein
MLGLRHNIVIDSNALGCWAKILLIALSSSEVMLGSRQDAMMLVCSSQQHASLVDRH